MKKIVFLSILLFLISCLSSKNRLVVKKENPPGTVWLRDNLYMDCTPVCNVHYREYEYYMNKKLKYNFSAFQHLVDSLPYYGFDIKNFTDHYLFPPDKDSSQYKVNLKSAVASNKYPFYYDYLHNPTYNNYPMINISYQVATAYCEWRTNMVMLYYSAIKSENKRLAAHKKIKYRLPSKEEWEYALKHLPIIRTYNDFSSKTDNIKLKKFLLNEEFTNVSDKKFTLSNFSEMVAEKNIAKGRNWLDSLSFKNENYTTSYEDATDWIGFRCICEVED